MLRIDTWLVQNGHFESRQRAQLAIKSGQVRCNGQPVTKPSQPVPPDGAVEVTGMPLRYVGQGGLKLEKAIQTFQLDFAGLTVLDAGASTGGFTDCALQHGAAKVFAVDVGTAQLAPTLRQHPQVVFYENQDIRQLEFSQLQGQPVDAVVCDVSFISLTQILADLARFLRPGGFLVLLVKPQFELEQRTALKGGIVKDPKLRQRALERVLGHAKTLGLRPVGMVETNVEAPGKKNVEFLLLLNGAN